MRYLIQLICIVAILMPGGGVNGQNIQYEFSQIRVGNTYNEITVSSVTQDVSGYLWIGTKGSGVFRYNGSEFIQFNREKGLPSDFILDIEVSRRGEVWVSTLNGTIIIDGEKVKQYQDSVFQKRVDNIVPGAGDSLYLVSEGNISLVQNKKVFQFDIPELYKNEKVTFLNYLNGQLFAGTSKGRLLINKDIGDYKAIQVSRGPINLIKRLSDDELAIISNDVIYTYNNGKIENFSKNYPGLYRAGVNDITRDGKNNIWISSYKGLFSVDKKDIIKYDSKNGLPANEVYDLYLDKDGILWLAAGNAGIFNYKGDQFSYLAVDNNKLGIITQIYSPVSKRNVHWVTTLGNGAYRVSSSDTVSLAELAGEKWLENELFTSVSYGGEALWFGTSDGRLIKYKNGFIDTYGLRPYTSGNVNALSRSVRGVWVATNNGLLLFNNKVIRHYDENDGLGTSNINDIYSDEFNNLLIATDNGLFKLEDNKINPVKFDVPLTGKVTQISKSKDQDYWLSTLGSGIIRIRNGKIVKYDKSDSLSSVNAFNIFIETNRKIWFSTDNGLECLYLDKEGDVEKTRLFNEKDGFYGISRYSHALSYSKNHLWIGTDNGVTLLNRAPDILGSSSAQLLVNDITANYGDLDIDLDKNVSQFVNSVDEIAINNDVTTLSFYFDCIDLTGKTDWVYRYRLLPVEKYWSPTSKQKIVSFSNLKPGNYTLEFKASNVNGTQSIEPISINFKILPPWYESPWFLLLAGILALLFIFLIVKISISSLRSYNRKLEERIDERTKEIQQQKNEIEEKKEELETLNEQLKNANNTIHDKNLQLEDKNFQLSDFNENLKLKVRERTASLEDANKELAFLNKELDTFLYKASHDLLGPLARLKGLCHLGKLEVKEEIAVKYMSLLANSADEMYIILKRLIDIISIRENEPSIKDTDYEKLISNAFKEVNTRVGDSINFKINNEYKKKIATDPELLKRVFVNLFSNSLLYKQSKTQSEVNVDILPNGEFVNFMVSDNGDGINRDSATRIFEMFYKGSEKSKGSGLGLYISKVAMDRLGGKIKLVESKKGKTVFQVSLKKEQ
ncbi:sensor histidine kinase [Mangrovivirga cuniculi]|nr:sensor histidine kinase [Mangrovivirga cuniculi]